MLFDALHPVVYGYLAARCPCKADAEDLTATVFTRVVERLPSFDPKRGSPRAWALSMARSAHIDHLRARRVESSGADVTELAVEASFGPAHEEDERLALVRQALLRYPPTVREMFALRYGDGLRIPEIAVVMSMSVAAVKQRFSRVLRELKRQARAGTLDEEVAHAH